MSIYKLYIKTHNKTGLKYLGQTKQNPYKYHGSGKYWKRHLKIHGNDITTEILSIHNDILDLRKQGLYYSKLFNIVESEEWANLCPEDGYGGFSKMTPEQIKKRNDIIIAKYRKPRHTYICHNCLKQYEKLASKVTGKNHYCSHKCWSIYENNRRSKNLQGQLEELSCQ